MAVLSMADKNEETEDSTCRDQQFQFAQNPVANTNTSESSLPSLREMLAVISESADPARNLQALMATSPCTSETSYHSTSTSPSNAPKAKQEVAEFDFTRPPEVNSPPSESSQPSTVTTNLTCYDENLQSFRNISLKHKDSLKFKVKVEKCENVVVGDGAQINIYCSQKGPLNQNNSSVQADGGVNPSGRSIRKWKKCIPPKNSVKNSASRKNKRKNVEEKIQTKWQSPMFLSDFTDAESLHNSIDQWLERLISYLLPEAQDLDDFESVIKLLEEAKKLRKSSVESCILKVTEAIQQMSILVCNEDSKKCDVLLTETQFVLAEFYAKEEDFLSSLGCLKTLEGSLSDDTQKSRLYAKVAKVMEHCLENSVDFTSCEDEFTCAFNVPVSYRNVDEIAVYYYEKALNFSHKEHSEKRRDIIQICCYLGKAAVYMRCWEGLVETARNLPEGRKNLLLTEKLFDKISPALKCQFYLAEASLLYYEERYKMAADKIQMAFKIAEEENFLEKRCLGSKRLHLLLAKLDKSTDVSKPEEELDDLNSVGD